MRVSLEFYEYILIYWNFGESYSFSSENVLLTLERLWLITKMFCTKKKKLKC